MSGTTGVRLYTVDIDNHIEGIIEYMKLGMSKDKAIEFERKGSCLSDKVWNTILCTAEERIT